MGETRACLHWAGLGQPCDETNKNFFYASVSISIRDVKIIKFLHSPWFDGLKPKDIAHSIRRLQAKNCSVQKALN
jgi:hypothetical protein